MTTYSTYGTATHSADELAQLIEARLGLTFVSHDSHYRGWYLLAKAGTHRAEIQPNELPDDDDGMYDPDHPDMAILLLVSGPRTDTTLTAVLNSIDGLALLDRETL